MMETIALNLTFLMTLGIGFLMFLGHVLTFTTILVLVGVGRLVALSCTAFWRRPAPWAS